LVCEVYLFLRKERGCALDKCAFSLGYFAEREDASVRTVWIGMKKCSRKEWEGDKGLTPMQRRVPREKVKLYLSNRGLSMKRSGMKDVALGYMDSLWERILAVMPIAVCKMEADVSAREVRCKGGLGLTYASRDGVFRSFLVIVGQVLVGCYAFLADTGGWVEAEAFLDDGVLFYGQ
jgi:hypothetical protein